MRPPRARVRRCAAALLVGAMLVACSSKRAVPDAPADGAVGLPEAAPPSPVSAASVASAASSPDAKAPADPRAAFGDWLRAHLPRNASGKVVPKEGGFAVVHKAASGDSALSIATAYLDLTDVYRAKDLAAEISKTYQAFSEGADIEIPHLLTAPYKEPDEGRLGWPADRALKGVFITGVFAGLFWPDTIEKVAARGLNAIVLDGKDYQGPVTHPTEVKIALEIDAAKNAPIPDFRRAIRFAHDRGIRIIVRIPCFHDPWAAKRAPRLSLMGNWGAPFPMGWLDPTNVEAEDYAIELAKEAIADGADEIQLDYVRFPVTGQSLKAAVMPPADGHRSQAIRKFVDRVHEVTSAKKVALSLDIFGVAATGDLSDIEALGQNMATIGGGAEALSPMVYPSHYSKGYLGFDEPGNHPEIIGIGTRSALAKLAAAKNKTTVIRPWLQASAYKASAYGPNYIQDEIRSAESSGAVGWLMWDPANSYWAVWQAIPKLPKE